MHFVNLNLALSAFLFRGSPVLAMRPIDPVAIETQLASPVAPVILVNASTIGAADADEFLPGERPQRGEAPVWCDRQERLADVPLDAPPNRSDVRVRWFALAFVSMLCATVIELVSEIRSLKPHSPDYGYDEALGTETSFLSSANFLSNCSDDSPATAGASKDGLDSLG